MYSSLIDAPINKDLVILDITHTELAEWLKRLGFFVGSHIVRNDDEIQYNPVRVRGAKGDVVVPSGLAIKILVHLEDGEKKPLTEMTKKDVGHIETIAGGKSVMQALETLGITEDIDITFVRALPHMDYITLIDHRERTRLSEGEAAKIWGCADGGEENQFYFTKKGSDFRVKNILGGRGVKKHLKTHGIEESSVLTLETIEQAQEAHAPGSKPLTISSPCGLRLYLGLNQASKIIVRSQ